jgi:phage baseplate assembly protein W
MATIPNVYSDIDLTFNKDPISGDVPISYGAQSIVRSITGLLQTDFYERNFQPSIGSNIKKHLFEPIDAVSTSSLETEILNVINNFEPRVENVSVKVVGVPDLNSYMVEITFFLVNETTPTTVNVVLERQR